jgi:ABC-2 type transport system ATP-binding protein
MTSAPLEIAAIELGYSQEPVIENLSLLLHPGSLTGLIGPNGAGKTTLLLAASGQFRPARGTISYRGRDIYRENLAYKYHIGYVHEDPFAWPWLTVAEFLAFTGRVKKVAAAQIPEQIDQLLQAVLLEEERHKLTGDLSQGMRKKLAIAAAFMGQPPLVFLGHRRRLYGPAVAGISR